MRTDKRQVRMAEIEAVAFDLLGSSGFEGTSMLAIANCAKASNETMYRWYGDKAGLFAHMVERNAVEVEGMLRAARAVQAAPLVVLQQVAPVLLGMLLSERAILLNRAAASDPTGQLGEILAREGRARILPLIEKALSEAVQSGEIIVLEGDDIGGLFIDVLVGDNRCGA